MRGRHMTMLIIASGPAVLILAGCWAAGQYARATWRLWRSA